MGRQSISPRPAAADAADRFGTQIAIARHGRKWSRRELVARAGVSERTIKQVETGDPKVAIGNAFNIAVVVGVPLFSASDTAQLAERAVALRDKLALLPKRVHAPRGDGGVDLNF
jgi:transcriptional regulator with XRE-family HTH domain